MYLSKDIGMKHISTLGIVAAAAMMAAACGNSPHQTASHTPSSTTVASASAAATASPAQPTHVAGGPSGCADLGGTVGSDQNCHIRSSTPTYNLEMSFPLDYPDQQAVTDLVTHERDEFINWVAEYGGDGRNRPYEEVVTAKTYRSAGSQSLVFEISEDSGAAHQSHPNTTFNALNYDLAKQAPITFDTLFKPGTNPLEVLNPIVQRELDAPAENLEVRAYQNFAITDDAVIFFFGENHVVPDNNGPQKVSVSRAELASVLA